MVRGWTGRRGSAVVHRKLGRTSGVEIKKLAYLRAAAAEVSRTKDGGIAVLGDCLDWVPIAVQGLGAESVATERASRGINGKAQGRARGRRG